MERRINENRLFSYVDTVASEHTHHRRDSAFDCTFAAYLFDHRRVKPYGFAVAGVNTFVAVGTFSYYRSRSNVACFKRMHKYFTVAVYKLCAERTNLFRYKCAEDLLRERCARRVILKRVGIKKLCADSVTENKTVRRCAVMV